MAVLMTKEEIEDFQAWFEAYPESKMYYESLQSQKQKDMFIRETRNTLYFQSFRLQRAYKKLGESIRASFKRLFGR